MIFGLKSSFILNSLLIVRHYLFSPWICFKGFSWLGTQSSNESHLSSPGSIKLATSAANPSGHWYLIISWLIVYLALNHVRIERSLWGQCVVLSLTLSLSLSLSSGLRSWFLTPLGPFANFISQKSKTFDDKEIFIFIDWDNFFMGNSDVQRNYHIQWSPRNHCLLWE